MKGGFSFVLFCFEEPKPYTAGACMLSRFSHIQLFATLWTVTHQAPLFMELSRQEYWNGLPCPPPGYLPNPGIKLVSLTSPELAGGFFTTSATWETQRRRWKCFIMILALVFCISAPVLMYVLSHCTSALQIWKLETLCLVALLFIIFYLTVPETSFFLNPTY